MTCNIAKLGAFSLVLSTLLIMPAQVQALDYNFCTEETATPSQELTDAIADFLNDRYEGGVKLVWPVCYGPNPKMGNQETWIYRAEFNKGEVLDVAVIEGTQSRRIAIQDGNGWSKWENLD